MFANQLLKMARETSAIREPPQIGAPNGIVLNTAPPVTLHRGNTPVRFPMEDGVRDPNFLGNPINNIVHPEPGRGVSVSVLGGIPSTLEWQRPHNAMMGFCRRRLVALLTECSKAMEAKHAPSKRSLERMVKEDSYMEVIRCVADLGFVEFDNIPIPFCYVKTANPFYPWASLISCPVETGVSPNPHHCQLELKKPTQTTELQGMATCQDGGWSPCPYLLKAAGESHNEDFILELERDKVSGVTLTVWDAIQHLLESFSDGGEYVDVQETFELCVYLTRMAQGTLRFEQQPFSGLEKEPRLVAFVELASHLDFYFEVDADYDIIDHDLRVAMSSASAHLRLVRGSLVALFDSGKTPKGDDDNAPEPESKQDIHLLPVEVRNYLVALLRQDDVIERCDRAWQEEIFSYPSRKPEMSSSWSVSDSHGPSHHRCTPEALSLARLLENSETFYVAAGSATLMAPNLSKSVIRDMETCIRYSPDVQRAISFVLDRYLLLKIGPLEVKGKICRRASDFITTVRSIVDTLDAWYIKGIPTPALEKPLSIGLIRVKSQFKSVGKVGVSLHNLIRTMNLALWRIPESHILWCLSNKHEFDLSAAVRRPQSRVTEVQAQEWARTVIRVSRDKLKEAGVRNEHAKLRAESAVSDSFVAIVAWDATLCRRAVKACVQNGLKQFGIRQTDYYHSTWNVDMMKKQLIL